MRLLFQTRDKPARIRVFQIVSDLSGYFVGILIILYNILTLQIIYQFQRANLF